MRLWLALLVGCGQAWVFPFHSLVTHRQLTGSSYLPFGRFALYSNQDLPGPFNASLTVSLTAYSEEGEALSLAVAISTSQELERAMQSSDVDLGTEMCCQGPICGQNRSKGREEVAVYRGKVQRNESVEWVRTS